MKLLIIPKPVMNKELAVDSYCFRFQQADEYTTTQNIGGYGGTVSSLCVDVLEMVGLNSLTNGLPIIVPIQNSFMLLNIDRQFPQPPDKIIFLLTFKIMPDDFIIENMQRLKTLGYKIALENISNYSEINSVLKLCDYILISCTNEDYRDILNKVTYDYHNILCIATDVDDMEMFNRLKNEKFDLFEGKFYSVPITKGNRTISPMKANYIQLLNIVRNEDFEIADVVKIVLQDPSLTISLLQFVNSPYLGLSQKINTIQHAASMMGQNELRKWVTTAISKTLTLDKPNEISKLSLMRAKFAENLAGYFEMGVHAQSLFLMGLFSILDVALDVPMHEALKEVVVSDNIFNALVYKEGSFAEILNFIFKYESASWEEVYILSLRYNLLVEDIFKAYIEAVGWYGSIIATVDINNENEEE